MSTPALSAKERVAVYVDGFNMYHALNDLGRPDFKWLNLMKLSSLLVQKNSQKIVRVYYFTATPDHFQNSPAVSKLLRHRQYTAALEAKGVICRFGHFASRTQSFADGRRFKATIRSHEEKQSDVALGLQVVHDAYEDLFDKAIIVCLDTDQLPTFELLKARFPGKRAYCAAPPGRAHPNVLQQAAAGILSIKKSQIERSLFGATISVNGRVAARRPVEYRPPG